MPSSNLNSGSSLARWARRSLYFGLALSVLSGSAFAVPVGPEIDPGSAGSALALLFGGVLILTDRFGRRRRRKGG